MVTCPKCGTRYEATQRLCPHDGSVLEPDQPSELKPVGQVLDGKYRLDAFLSRGGMGTVYRATHVMLGRTVAVKLIKPDLVASPDMVRRFQREARAVTHLKHPNIVDVYDLGQTADGTLYIAMELVPGASLNEVIRSTGPLPAGRIAGILGQVAGALAMAHRHSIVHRDLKPHNIMVSQDDEGREVAKLLDFGIAKTFEIDANTQLTATGSTLGTPQYMSPEQATGAEVDARSDLYSLGIILYEMLIGEVPFSDPSTAALLVKQMTEAPVPPSRRRPDLHVSPALEAIALRCLEKDPAKRFQNATELGAELQRASIELSASNVATIPLRPAVPPIAPAILPGTLAAPVSAAAKPATVAGFVPASAPASPVQAAAPPPPLPPLPPPVPGTRPTVASAVVAPPPPAAASMSEPLQPRSRSIFVPIAAIVLLLGVVSAAGYWVVTRSVGSAPAPDNTTAAQAPAATPAMAEPAKPDVSPATAAPPPATSAPAGAGAPATPTSTETAPTVAATGATSSPNPGVGTGAAASIASATPTGSAASTASIAPPVSAAPAASSSRSAPSAVPQMSAAPSPSTRAAAPSPPQPPPAPRAPAASTGDDAPPTQVRADQATAPRMQPGRAGDAADVPATPTIAFQCTGAAEVCLPMRSAIEDAAERAGVGVARGTAAPEIVIAADVTILDERQQNQFGTKFVVRTYSVDVSGESRRFDQGVPMPAPKTFTADARFGRERYMENARVVAADAIERVQQFWKKRVP